MAKKKKATKTDTASFEQSLEQLEDIVAKLESGKLPLAESLEQYESGVKHLKSCYELLSDAERRISLVSGLDASGKPKTKNFDAGDDESLEEKGASRSRRRSARSQVDDESSLFDERCSVLGLREMEVQQQVDVDAIYKGKRIQ